MQATKTKCMQPIQPDEHDTEMKPLQITTEHARKE